MYNTPFDGQIVELLMQAFKHKCHHPVLQKAGIDCDELRLLMCRRAMAMLDAYRRDESKWLPAEREAAAKRRRELLFHKRTAHIPVLHVPFHRGLRKDERFGELVVVRFLSRSADGYRKIYECLCDCGRTRRVTERALLSGKVTSCAFTHEPPNAKSARRKAAKLLRTPKWADRDAIAAFYARCPRGYHVDHIVPLQGDCVSGLHVIDNLQYLPAAANISKGNRFTPQITNGENIGVNAC